MLELLSLANLLGNRRHWLLRDLNWISSVSDTHVVAPDAQGDKISTGNSIGQF